MKKRIPIGKLLNNNKIAFVFSVVVAIIIWLVVAIQFSDLQNATFGEIPVSIDTTMTDKLDLRMFGQTDFKVTVNVTGKRYEVSPAALSAEDFIVTASTVNVSSAGKYTLPINVKSKDTGRDVEIVSFSPESVDVYFDYSLEKNFPVEVQLNKKNDDISAEGYIEGEPILSVAEVTVSGAASEVQKIDRVVAKINIDAPLQKTTKYEKTSLAILNASGGIVRSNYVTVVDNISTVTVTVPIFKVMQFTPSVRFKNTPAYYLEHPVHYTYSPVGSVNAAVSTELLSSADNLSLGTIDFSKIHPGFNSFVFRTKDIQNIRVLDDVDEFSVHFNMDGVQEKTFTLSMDNITISGLRNGVSSKIMANSMPEITIVGPAAELESITADQIHVTADASSVHSGVRTAVVPLSFTIDNVSASWISGAYTVALEVS